MQNNLSNKNTNSLQPNKQKKHCVVMAYCLVTLKKEVLAITLRLSFSVNQLGYHSVAAGTVNNLKTLRPTTQILKN